jgi:hypothetical protein
MSSQLNRMHLPERVCVCQYACACLPACVLVFANHVLHFEKAMIPGTHSRTPLSNPVFLNRRDASRFRNLEAFLPGLLFLFFLKFWRKNLGQKPKLVRDRESKLKICHRPGLGAQKVEKHWSNPFATFVL